jgi:exodeoxyribonuclease VII small subunit
MASNLSPADAPMPDHYEAAVAELEQWVSRMESGELPLDQLLAAYQRSAQLLEFCRSKLEAIEQQIQVLDDGVMKPWLENQ